jgi:Pyridoxamine 5'-phosphate oxidase
MPERDEYGPGDEARPDAVLPWETVEGWLVDSRYYWLGATRADGRPHAVAVWAVWLEDGLWFATAPTTLVARALRQNPQALAHTESASEVVVVHGAVERPVAESVPGSVVDAYEVKYDWRLDPADPGMPFHVLRPRHAVSWLASELRGTATRWEFARESSS